MGVGGFCEGAKQSSWQTESRWRMLFEMQDMLKFREWLNTLQMCEERWGKSYESGRTTVGKMSIEVRLFPGTNELLMVWVAERSSRPFLMLLQHFILLMKHRFSSTVSFCCKTYSYTGAYITHLHCDHKVRIVYVLSKQLRQDGVAIKHDRILLGFIQDLNHNWFLHPSDYDSSKKEADGKNACIDPE